MLRSTGGIVGEVRDWITGKEGQLRVMQLLHEERMRGIIREDEKDVSLRKLDAEVKEESDVMSQTMRAKGRELQQLADVQRKRLQEIETRTREAEKLLAIGAAFNANSSTALNDVVPSTALTSI